MTTTAKLQLINGWLAVRLGVLGATYPERERDETLLARVSDLLANSDKEPLTGEAEEIINVLSVVDQARIEAVLASGFQRTTIHHHPPVATLGLNPSSAFNTSSEERLARAVEYGFRFNAFNVLLAEIGFWQRVGPEMERLDMVTRGRDWSFFRLSLDDPEFPALLNALNGCRRIDYEALFPEAQDLFDLVRTYKFGVESTPETRFPSALSTADIIFCIMFERLNRALSPDRRAGVTLWMAETLGSRVDNTTRIRAYKALYDISELLRRDDVSFSEALDAANMELALPEGHAGRTRSQFTEREPDPDVIIIHAAGDFGCTTRIARIMMAHNAAYLLPIGGHTPHDREMGDDVTGQCSEAEEMAAIAMSLNEDTRYVGLPNMSSADTCPVQPWRILPGDHTSFNTPTNAVTARERLAVLYDVLGRPLHVLLLTTHQHGARLRAEYSRVLSPECMSSLKVVTHMGPFQMDFVLHRATFVLANLICEYLKRLHLVAVR